MRKTLTVLMSIVVLIAVGAVLAVQAGSGSVAGACAGPLPTGAFTGYRVQAADGNCLQGYAWAPAAGAAPVRAVVVTVHGLHDHARRYEGLAHMLGESGIALLAQDHRGHAGSGGAPQRLDSLDQLLADVELAVQEARRRHPGVPVFIHGHSLGGMVAAHYAAQRGEGLAGAVISSAALKLPAAVSGGQVRVVSLLSSLAPNLGLEAVDVTQVVRDPAARAALAADPLISREKLPARTVGTLFGGVDELQPRLATIKPPLLILHGQADTITDPAGSRLLHQAAASSDKALKLYDSALHDLLHEPEGPAVARAITEFVEQRVAPRS
jgi:alpha-beta hydrolase superfamily lysophospholipase